MSGKFRLMLIVVILLAAISGLFYSTTAHIRAQEDSPGVNRTAISGALETLPNGVAASSTAEGGLAPANMTEGFEGSWPAAGWDLMDFSANGEYLLGKRNCHPLTGTYGGWMVGGGAQGSLLGCTDEYTNTTETWASYGPFDLTGATSASLTFYLWGESEYEATCAYDYLYTGSSTDGTSFNGVRYCGDWTGGGDGNGYSQETLDLSGRLGESQVWVAFAFFSDSSVTYQGFTIDDLALTINNSVTHTPSPTQTPTRTATPTATATRTVTPISTTPTPTLTLSPPSANRNFIPLVLKDYPPGPTGTPTLTATPTQTGTITPTPTATSTSTTPTPTPPTYFAPTGDTFIVASNPATNYGDNPWLDAGGSDSYRSLLAFDLSAIPVGTTIEQATLELWHAAGSGCSTNTFAAYRISGTWTEMSVTWNAQPTSAEAYGSVTFDTCGYGFRDFDVTDLVQAWVDGLYPNYGIMLGEVGAGSGIALFISNDSPLGDHPSLTVSYGP